MSPTMFWIFAIAALIVAAGIFISKKMQVGPAVPDNLQPGQPLPDFSAVHEDGSEVRSADLRGHPTVILFVRGGWCPFCSKQVEEITSHYNDINSLGAKLVFITPKPLGTTRRVGDFYKVEFDFWLDDSLAIARSLGLLLTDGVPKDWAKEYGHDAFWPAALVVDAEGIIRYSKVSRLVFDRPNSATLVKELKKL